MKQRRTEWIDTRIPAVKACPERVVVLDETAVKTNLTRQCGWAVRGERLNMDAPFGNWGTQTLIAGLRAQALIAPWVIKGQWMAPRLQLISKRF